MPTRSRSFSSGDLEKSGIKSPGELQPSSKYVSWSSVGVAWNPCVQGFFTWLTWLTWVYTDDYKIWLVISSALSYTQLVFRHATETQLGLKWQKLAIYRAWPWISNSDFQAGPELGTFGSRVQRFFQPAVTTPTDWAKSLRLGSFSSDWTAALFRDPDKHER